MKRIIKAHILLVVLLLLSCMRKEEGPSLIPIAHKAINDTSSIFYSDFSNYSKEIKHLPIGIFHEGIEGLTVLESFLTIDEFDNITGKLGGDGISDFAGESFIYLDDRANAPYSEYQKNDRNDLLREIIVKNTLFLMNEDYYNMPVDNAPTGVKDPSKIIIAATSNLPSVLGVEDAREMLKNTNSQVSIVSFIESTVKCALDNHTKDNAIGLILAPSSQVSEEYRRIFARELSNENSEKIQFFSQLAEDFSPFDSTSYSQYRVGTRDGDIDVTLMDRYNFDMTESALSYVRRRGEYQSITIKSPANFAKFQLVSLIEKHRRTGSKMPIKSIILGSVVTPDIVDSLSTVIENLRTYEVDGNFLYKDAIYEDVKIIDPATSIAKNVYEELRKSNNLAFCPEKSTARAFITIPSSSIPSRFVKDDDLTANFLFNRELAEENTYIKELPLSSRYISIGDQEIIKNFMPKTFSLIKNTF